MRFARRNEHDRFEMDDDITMVRWEAPTNEGEWLALLTGIVGDADKAAAAYRNVLSAIENDDELSVIWHEDDVAA